MKRFLTMLLVLLLAGCAILPPGLNTDAPASDPGETTNSAIQVFFSGDKQRGDRLVNALVDDIRAARESVDVAMYNFSLDEAGFALIEAQQRGVRVRILLDSDAGGNRWVGRFDQARVPLTTDGRESLMHNKFVIIDGQKLWTGSLNLTRSGIYKDANNMLRFDSAEMAGVYTRLFDLMAVERRFSQQRTTTTSADLRVGGSEVEALFSPEDGAAARLIRLIDSADSSLDILAYSFTNNRLADAILRAQDRGVRVRMLFDEDQTHESGSDYGFLRQSGVEARLDGSPELQHNKVILVDGEVTVSGSYNFTRSADRSNDENIVIVHDPSITSLFTAEFERLYEMGE